MAAFIGAYTLDYSLGLQLLEMIFHSIFCNIINTRRYLFATGIRMSLYIFKYSYLYV